MSKKILISLTESEWDESISAMKILLTQIKNTNKDKTNTIKLIEENILTINKIMFRTEKVQNGSQLNQNNAVDDLKIQNLTNDEFNTIMDEITQDTVRTVKQSLCSVALSFFTLNPKHLFFWIKNI